MKFSESSNISPSKASQAQDIETAQLRKINSVAIFVVFFAIGIVGLYFYQFGTKGLSTDNGVWGTFGDYFGGIVNPITGLLTIFLVLHSVRIQRKELKLSLSELVKSNDALISQNRASELQNFEQTFFSWLNLYREQISAIQFESRDGNLSERTGLHALKRMYDNALNEQLLKLEFINILENLGQSPITIDDDFYNNASLEIKNNIYDLILEKWDILYKNAAFQLDGTFRTLFRLITWIDKQPPSILTNDQKWFYVGVVRAQLSWIELVYQYYNGLTDRGAKFMDIANKYALFDNLNMLEYPSLRFIQSREKYKPSAFSSEAAKFSLFV